MAAKFFISYRRNDSSGSAGRIHDRLEREFGVDLIFMDVDAIPLGVNFIKVLRKEVAKCDVLLAIIGPTWLDVRDDAGKRRLEDPNDLVRVEIATALQRDIPVIPILVDNGRIPKANQLPDDLKELALRNGLEVRHASFRGDMEKLIRELNSPTRQIETPPPPSPPEERGAKTDASEKKDEAVVLRQGEDHGPSKEADTASAAEVAQDMAAAKQPTAEEVQHRAQVELPNAEEIQGSAQAGQPKAAEVLDSAAAVQPNVEQVHLRQVKEAQQAFANAKREDSSAAIAGFLAAYPDSDCAAEARALHAELVAREEKKRDRKQEAVDWKAVVIAGAIFIGVPAVVVMVWGWFALLGVVLFLVGAVIVIAVLGSGYGGQVLSTIAFLVIVSIA